jgi:ABC-type Fe3+/spermidine/putrescine transport system ATPase subunit
MGRIESQGTPEDVYHRPSTAFSASFVGNKTVIPVPRSALSAGVASGLPGQLEPVPVPGHGHGDVSIVLDPENVRCSRGPDPGAVQGRVMGRRFLGRGSLVSIQTQDLVFQAVDLDLGLNQLDDVYVSWGSQGAHVIVEGSSPHDPPDGTRQGEPVLRAAGL